MTTIHTPNYPSLGENPARLKLESYPVQFELPLRWSDVVDGYRVGPLGMARYYEDARMDFVAAIIGKERLHDKSWKGFLRQCTIEMLADATFPGALTVGGCMLHIGNTSYKCGFGLFQHGICVSLSDSVVVWVDDDHRPHALSEEDKAPLRKEMLRP